VLYRFAIFLPALLGILFFTQPALAACSSPTGTSGDLLFNSASGVMQFCNGFSWMQAGDKPKGGPGCTTPSGTAGDVLFNSAYRVMQHCNGQEWSAWGKLNGTGTFTGICATPSGTTGDLLFNSAYGILQYCDGNTWQQTGGVPSTLSLNFLSDQYSLSGTAYTGIANLITASGGSFTRSTTATYFDSTGTMQSAAINAPRLDYDPATHASKGLLIEEARTNILLQSAVIDNAAWFKGAVGVTANQAVAPDGTMTADKVSANGGNFAYWGQNGSWAAGQTVTRSIYVKPGIGGGGYILFEIKDSNALTYVAFILNGAGSIQNNSSGTKAWIQYVGNGWYRIMATRTFAGASGGANEFGVNYINGPGAAGVGEYAYFWGGQFEVGESPTSYIPTTTSTVTRAEDSMTVPTGLWFNSASGALIADFNSPYLGSTNWPGPASLDDGTQSNTIHFFIANPWAKALYAEMYVAGVSNFGQNSPVAYTEGTNARIGISYSPNYAVTAFNGTAGGAASSSLTMPTVTLLRVGASRGDLGPINGWIRRIDYYPYILNTTDLQRKTLP
jgi:hypothetical protein